MDPASDPLSEAGPRSVAERLHTAGSGALLEQLPLTGPRGRLRAASLCRTRGGLWLVHEGGDAADSAIDLLAAGRQLRYRPQTVGARLEVDGRRYAVPWGRSEQVQRMIALARVERAFGRREQHPGRARRDLDDPDGAWAWSAPFVDALAAHERQWLVYWLDGDERLLAFKRLDAREAVDSPVWPGVGAVPSLLITERRQLLVAIGPVGDFWTLELGPQALELVGGGVGRPQLIVGERRLRIPAGDAASLRALVELPARRGDARLRGFARALWRHPGSTASSRAAAALRELAPRDALAALAAGLLVEGPPQPPEPRAGILDAVDEPLGWVPAEVHDALRRLADGEDREAAGATLLRWWLDWQVDAEIGELIVDLLSSLGRGGLEVGLALHERVRPALQAKLPGDGEEAALLDFVLVEHWLALGRPRPALELLHARRRRLPSEQLDDLLPPSPERGGQRIRIELFELLAEAQAQLGEGDVEVLAELARLQPLIRTRLAQLVERLGDSQPGEPSTEAGGRWPALARRAERIAALLADGGFAEPRGALPAGAGTLAKDAPAVVGDARPEPRVQALGGAELELLRHPAARADGVLGRLQGALAKVAVPDCSALKRYCERANLVRAPALGRALADATVMLGLGGVEVFVSRGDASIGLRAYEGGGSFLLVGGDHFKADADAFLDGDALRFAVTAELAHLRFAHSRVTSDEVWAGTFDLGLTGLSVLVAAAPLLKGLKAPAKQLIGRLGSPAIERMRKKLARRDSPSLSSDNSQLIAAHRVMQLSADRAGLVACRDPRAAIRAMFAVHPSYLAQWPLVVEHGLHATLTRQAGSPEEQARIADLAVRVAALLSFYLSDDYAELSRAVWG